MADRFAKLNHSNPFGDRPTPRLDDLTGGMVEQQTEHEVVTNETHYVTMQAYPALSVDARGVIPGQNFEVSKRGLFLTEHASIDDLFEAGNAVLQFDDSMQFIIGDLVNYGLHFQITIDELAKWLNRDQKTIENWASVCLKFPYALRKANLYFGHYNLVTGRFYARSAELLEMASQKGWSVQQFRDFLQSFQTKKKSNPDASKKLIREAKQSIKTAAAKASKLTVDERRPIIELLQQTLNELTAD